MADNRDQTIKLRVSEAELETIKASADRHGLSVSGWVREAALVWVPAAAPEPDPELHPPERPEHEHRPKPGRLALVCTRCNRRQFGDPGWRCPEHPAQTVVQRNRPYLGQEVPTPDIGLPVVDPMPPALR